MQVTLSGYVCGMGGFGGEEISDVLLLTIQTYAGNPFDRWFGFLRTLNIANEKDSVVFITVAGREFLKYLVAAGKAGPFHG